MNNHIVDEVKLLSDVVTEIDQAISSLEKTEQESSKEVDRAVESLKAANEEMRRVNEFERKKRTEKK